MFTDNNHNNSLLHISLIIDDTNQTKVYLKPNDNLEEISYKLAMKYDLSEDTKNKIHSILKAFVTKAKKEKEIRKFKSKDIVEKNINRLYYEGIKMKKLKNENLKKTKEKELQKLFDNHTFSPKINYLSQLYAERNHHKIEDKLLRNGEISKEKLVKKKIINNIISCQKYQATESKKFSPKKQEKDENKKIPNFFNLLNEKDMLNSKDDFSILSKDNYIDKKNKNKHRLEIEAVNESKQFFSFGDNQFTPRPLNASQTTIISNKSKQTYKNIFIHNKEDKMLIKNSFKNNNGNDSFSSNKSDLNFLNKRETILHEKKSLNNDNEIISHFNKPKEKHNSNFNNPLINEQIINRTCNSQNSYNKKRSVNKEITKRNEVMPSITELSYFADDKQFSDDKINHNELITGRNNDKNEFYIINSEPSESYIHNKDLFFKEMKCLTERENIKENKSNLNLTKQDKKVKSISKSLSKLYLKSRVTKEKNKNIHDSLYNNAKAIRFKREMYVKEFTKKEFSYSPSISKMNIQTTKETSKEFINRLVNSKKINDHIRIFNKSALQLEHSSQLNSQMIHSIKNVSRNKICLNGKLNITNKEGYNDNSTNLLSTTDQYSLKSTRRYLNTSINDKSLKDQLEKSYRERNSIDKFYRSDFSTRSNENIKMFKLNNLKEIFEVIFTFCNNIDDIYDLDSSRINKNIKLKLIIPCCNRMKERNLEFNFQNFYLISNELMKNFV